MSSNAHTNVLLIEDNATDAKAMQSALASTTGSPFRVEWVSSIEDALVRLNHREISSQLDLILLNLHSANGGAVEQNLHLLDKITHAAGNVPIVVVGNDIDERTLGDIMARGAQDYLCKNRIDSYWLPRALRYVTEHKVNELVVQAAEGALYEEKERAQVTLNAIADAVITTDISGNITYVNSVAETMTGWSAEDALGLSLLDVFTIVDGVTREAIENPALRAIAEEKTVELSANSILIQRDGSERAIEDSVTPIYDRDHNITGAVIVFHDVSESRTIASKMTHLAQHDFLTGLPNRMLLTERLSQAMGLAHRNRTQVALLFIDLDRFKHINDSLGHAVGDELLQSVAERLVSCVRSTDTVCRQGGDEFVILLSEIDRAEDAALTAEKLLSAFSTPHNIDVHELHVTLSVGISVYPSDGKSAEALMQNADAAMYHAKAIGRNNFQFFKMEMNARAVHRASVESSLRRAIRQQEFVLHYQPKIDISSGTMIGAEALIRWQDPKLGLMQPSDFLSIAEECGLIVPIGGWVLRAACNQLRAWLNAGLRILPMAINVSAAELKHKYFLDGVAQVLRETGLPPYYLEFEFTETILMRDAELSVNILETLKKIGVQLAIDDFGTGYSSLSYLKRFPVDTLKIDKSFMRNLDLDNDNATIVSAIIAMGKNLKQRVLAEGVETAEQFEFLRAHRCNEAQGSYLGEPLSAEEFSRLLVNNALPALCVRQRTDQA